MNLPAPSAILFDLDGTLIDSIELIVQSFQHCTNVHLGAPRDRDLIVQIIGLSLPDELERVAPGRGNDLLMTYRKFFNEQHDALIAGYDGIDEMLDALNERQMPLAIVTAKSLGAAQPSFRQFRLYDRFATILTHEDTVKHKPDPEPLLLAAQRLTAEPETCWYVGDSTHDMHAARAAGMTAIGAAWGPYGRETLTPLADYVLDTPGELLEVLGFSHPPSPSRKRKRGCLNQHSSS